MNYRLHHSLFNEIMNRYDLMFVSVIRSHFNNQEDQKDIYQEFSIHLFMLIEAQYSKSIRSKRHISGVFYSFIYVD